MNNDKKTPSTQNTNPNQGGTQKDQPTKTGQSGAQSGNEGMKQKPGAEGDRGRVPHTGSGAQETANKKS